MKFYVYLLISKKNDNIISYVGYTNNLENRLSKHNSSRGAKFTRGRKWEMIYKKACKTKSEAIKEEHKLKKNYLLRKKIKNKFLYG